MSNTVSASDHLDRVKAAVAGTYGLTTLNRYITEKTRINGKLYSFKDHEFQLAIGESTALEDITVKCAQVGVSEYYYRWALAACRNINDFTVIYTFPNAGDAEQNCVARINPIIKDSLDLQSAVNPDVNNSAMKQFGRNSFMYMRGTRSQAGAVSVPADCIINDEWDKSDIEVATMYAARLQHKPYKIWKKFSTPTFAKYGILKEAETARRMRHMQTCNHCNFEWLPSYFTDVKIPGYDGDLRDINKANLKDVKWQLAVLLCPKCGREPERSHENLRWVCENPSEAYPNLARFITPFSAPKIISIPYLVEFSTKFKKYSEFMNQGLGLAAEGDEDNLNETEIRSLFCNTPLLSSELHIFASDMGLICHAVIGRMTLDGTLLVVHREKIPLGNFENRRRELISEYRCILSVHDTQPYVDMIARITEYDSNAYGSVFATFKSGPIFRVDKQEEDKEEGKMNLQQIKIRRNPALDALMDLIKKKKVVIAGEEDDELVAHLTSLKRIQKFDKEEELVYVWEKTDEVDHYHFALLYLYTGCTLRDLAGTTSGVYAAVPIMQALKNVSANIHRKK